MVSAKQKMITVVDAAAELCIQKRTAAPAGVSAGFVQPHTPTPGGKFNRGSQTGETGADHVHRAQPGSHTKPYRNTSHSLAGFDTLTRVAGSRHPEHSKAESVEW